MLLEVPSTEAEIDMGQQCCGVCWKRSLASEEVPLGKVKDQQNLPEKTLLENGISSCFPDNQICDLLNGDADKKGSVASPLQPSCESIRNKAHMRSQAAVLNKWICTHH